MAITGSTPITDITAITEITVIKDVTTDETITSPILQGARVIEEGMVSRLRLRLLRILCLSKQARRGRKR
jgi:hypothetical protein